MARLLPIFPGAERDAPKTPYFLPDPEADELGWWQEVGAPAGLEPFEVTAERARRILRDYERTVALCPFAPVGSRPADFDDLLCQLLVEYGPLQRVVAVVPFAPVEPDSEPRAVVLAEFHREIRDLVAACRAIADPPVNKADLSEQLVEDSSAALDDIELGLRFEEEQVVFEPRPTSLRAFLWMEVLERWGRTPTRVCPLCKTEFEVPFGRGRPPKFCPKHRNERSRKQYKRMRTSSRPFQESKES